jgi:hypothetical protein
MPHVMLHHEHCRVVDRGIWRAGDHIAAIQVGGGGRVQILARGDGLHSVSGHS